MPSMILLFQLAILLLSLRFSRVEMGMIGASFKLSVILFNMSRIEKYQQSTAQTRTDVHSLLLFLLQMVQAIA